MVAEKGRNKAQTPARKWITPQSVRLEPGEKVQLNQIAAELRVSRHELMKYAIRQFLKHWKNGRDLPSS